MPTFLPNLLNDMKFLLPVCAILVLTACQTTTESNSKSARPFIGMTEEAWLNSTHSTILLEIEGNRVTYKANEDLYFFVDGKLSKMVASEK